MRLRISRLARIHRVSAQILAAVIAGMLVFAWVVSGGTPSVAAEQQKRIQFFTMQLQPVYNDYINGLIKKYESLHPDVKIAWLDYPAEGYQQALLLKFMGKTAPDVINLGDDYLISFGERNVLLPLEGVVPRAALDTYFPDMLRDACSYKGTLYALPWYLALDITMYNKKIFEQAGLDPKKPPRTNTELADYAKIIKEKTGLYGFFPIYAEAGSLKEYLVDSGVRLVDETGKRAAFDTPEGVETLAFWSDLYKNGLVPKEALTAMHRRPIELYKSGKLAVFQSGPQFLKLVKSDAPEVYRNTLCAPRICGKVERYPVIAANLAIARQSKRPKEAADFAAFVTNGENQLAFCKITTILPSVISAAKDPYFTHVEDTPEGQARKISAQQLFKGVVRWYPEKNRAELNRAMDDAMQKACLGRVTPKEALDEAARKWTELLNR
jgi:putative chitobiose transport system substrate-binding protein